MPTSPSRRLFVRTLGFGGAALAVSSIVERGREAMAAPAGASPAVAPGAAQVTPPPASAAPGKVIRLDSNENAHGPCPAALQGLQGALGEACRYPDAPEVELRLGLARFHSVAAENILLGCGSTEILRMAVQAFTAPDRALVAAEPTFEEPARFARGVGAPVKSVRVRDDLKLDLGGMAEAAAGAGLIYLCNPNNPTATTHDGAAVDRFVARVLDASPGTRILADEAYFDFVEDPTCTSAIPLALRDPRVVVTRTFSKIHGMAGLRVGYAVGQADSLEAMRKHKLPSGINGLGAAAALASLGQDGHVAEQRRLNHEARELTSRGFEAMGYRVVPSDTNFMMVDIRRDAAGFQAACRQQDVLVGRPFPPLTNYARISIGTLDEMRRALEVFRRVL
jgi:histidinol-phosphate aminotransferase